MQWTISHLTDKKIVQIEVQGETTVDEIIKMSEEAKNFEQNKLLRTIKIAYLFPESDYNQFRFFETLSQNKGFQIRIFRDKDPAVEWLTKK